MSRISAVSARIILCILASAHLSACSEPTGPTSGFVKVSTVTVGGDLDLDAYQLKLGADRVSAIGLRSTVVLQEITLGTHVLTLDDVAANCVPDNPSRSVTIVPGDTVAVAFSVDCRPTGVEVITRTTGVDQPTGYLIRTGDRQGGSGLNASTIMTRFSPGAYDVSISPNQNCTVKGGSSAKVTVLNRTVTPVLFEVNCTRTEKHFVFVRDTVDGKTSFSAILSASEDGLNIVPLINGHGPSWSPDGRRLLLSNTTCYEYSFYYYYDYCGGGVFVIEPESREVSPFIKADYGVDPAWSADGTMIAFTRVTSTSSAQVSRLYLSGIDASAPSEVLTHGMSAHNPHWAPDGRRIVFGCSEPAAAKVIQQDICVINRDGTAFTRLINDSFIDQNPAWSPDGTTIAFATNRAGGGRLEIALMTPAGANIKALTVGFDPAWLPDGSKIIFAGDDGIFSIHPDGSNIRRLTRGRHSAPAWRP